MAYKISVDDGKCIGCGACAATCPKAFGMRDGRAYPIKFNVEELDGEEAAKSSCPMQAISIEEKEVSDGN